MEKRLFDEFWKVVQEGLHSGVATVLRQHLPKLDASLHALDVTSVYWSCSSSHSQAQVLLCGATGFGRMEIEMKSAQPPENTWSHTIDLSVLPWSTVTEITQHFIREGWGGQETRAFVLSKAIMCLRSGIDPQINLLPAPDTDHHGGVRVADNRVESFTDQAVFVAAVIKGQRGRGAETWERDST